MHCKRNAEEGDCRFRHVRPGHRPIWCLSDGVTLVDFDASGLAPTFWSVSGLATGFPTGRDFSVLKYPDPPWFLWVFFFVHRHLPLLSLLSSFFSYLLFTC